MATNLQRAAAVAKLVDLKSVNLGDAAVRSNIDPENVPENLEISTQFRGSHELRSTKETDRIHVTVDFQLEAVDIQTDTRTTVLDLKASFKLVYALVRDAVYPEGDLEEFARLNGAYNAWPYWRELVQTVSGRIGIAGIVIPVFQPQRIKAETVEPDAERSFS